MRLTGKVALVTGASKGIGRVIALSYAGEGADLAIISRDVSELKKVKWEIEGLGRKCVAVACDVREEEDVETLVKTVIAGFGRIDVLVNNAAAGMILIREDYLLETVRFWDINYDIWKTVIDTNLNGLFLVSRYVAREMIKRRKGKIVNILTRHETMTRKGFSPYGPSKAGAEALTMIMAKELEEHNVQVNGLAPGGPIRTAMMPKEPPDKVEKIMMMPEEIVPAAVFLASDESGSTTGQFILASQWNAEHKIAASTS